MHYALLSSYFILATPGDDYVTTGTRLTFSEQNHVQCFSVTIVDDELAEDTSDFFVVDLRNDMGLLEFPEIRFPFPVSQTIVNIQDNDGMP